MSTPAPHFWQFCTSIVVNSSQKSQGQSPLLLLFRLTRPIQIFTFVRFCEKIKLSFKIVSPSFQKPRTVFPLLVALRT